ncbi:MAG: hypothetical protein WDN44_06450 [Sphingomonas sp.]
MDKVRQIRDLYEETRLQVVEITHSQYAMAAVDAFFRRPIIAGTVFAREAGFNHRVTANNMLRQLEGEGLITRIREGSGRMAAIYALPRLINIAEGRTVIRSSEPRLL